MKKFIFILPILFLFMGCPPDDGDEPQTYSIVAKWKFVKQEYYENNTLVDTEIEEQNDNCPDYVEFKSNNTFETVYHDENCIPEIDESGTYVYSNNTLSTTSSVETYNLTVSSLTDTELILEEVYTENGITFRDVSIFEILE